VSVATHSRPTETERLQGERTNPAVVGKLDAVAVNHASCNNAKAWAAARMTPGVLGVGFRQSQS